MRKQFKIMFFLSSSISSTNLTPSSFGSETVSLGGRSTATAASIVSNERGGGDSGDNASTKALAGSILAYRFVPVCAFFTRSTKQT